MKFKEYEMPDGRKAVFWYDENGVGKITLECMDMLMGLINDRKTEPSGYKMKPVEQTEPLDKDINVRSKTEPQTDADQHVQHVEYVGNDEKSRCWTCKHFERMHETPIASDGNYYTYVVCTAKECHYEPKTEPQYDAEEVAKDINRRVEMIKKEWDVRHIEPKTEPQTCSTCKFDHEKWFEAECDSCCEAHSNWKPKDEPQTSCKTCRFGEVDEGYVRCAYYSKATEQDEPQYEISMGTIKCDNCSEYGSFKCSKCDGEMYFKRFEDEPQTDCAWK